MFAVPKTYESVQLGCLICVCELLENMMPRSYHYYVLVGTFTTFLYFSCPQNSNEHDFQQLCDNGGVEASQFPSESREDSFQE